MVIHRDKLRWLFWLRWKMLLRGYRREKFRLLGTIIQFVILVPLFLAAAVGLYFAYHYLAAPANFEVLFLVLTAAMLLWLLLPMLQFSSNEGLDISKLMQFPLTRWEIMCGLLFSSIFDIFSLGLLLILTAAVVGFTNSVPVALMLILTLLVFAVMIIGFSQLMLALLSRVLQSRRFRDISYILIVVFSSSCYVFQQLALNGIGTQHFYDGLLNRQYSPYLQWLPSGFTARAVESAVQGNWLTSFGLLLATLAIALVVLYLWQLVIERSLTAPETSAIRARRGVPPPVAVARPQAATPVVTTDTGVAASPGLLSRLVAPQTWAITLKEFRYYQRDPQLKAMIFQSIIYMVLVIVLPLFNISRNTTGGGIPGGLLISVPLVVFLYMITLSLNSLGLEREALTTLFLFPLPPQRLLFGKNLAIFLIGLVELVVLMAVGAFITHSWNLVAPVIIAGLAGMGIVLGCGNIASVFFPQRMRQMRGFRATGASNTSGNGCLLALVRMAIVLVALVLLLPVGLALALPYFLGALWIWTFAIPLSLAYGIAFHQIATRLVAPYIVKRTPEILMATTRE